MNKADVVEFFSRLAADNPHPETELESGNPYQLLVAVVLSAQATDVGVNKATRKLFQQVHTPAQMVALGEEKLKEQIKTIWLYNTNRKSAARHYPPTFEDDPAWTCRHFRQSTGNYALGAIACVRNGNDNA